MTIAVDLGRKTTKQTNKTNKQTKKHNYYRFQLSMLIVIFILDCEAVSQRVLGGAFDLMNPSNFFCLVYLYYVPVNS